VRGRKDERPLAAMQLLRTPFPLTTVKDLRFLVGSHTVFCLVNRTGSQPIDLDL
jgi:hypothetical protein